MKKSPIAAVLSSLVVAALVPLAGPGAAWGAATPSGDRPEVSAVASTSPYPSLASCRGAVQHETYSSGVLTVATDDPAYSPWFLNNTPTNGKGYESAVAYQVGSLLGFDHQHVKWVTEPFDSSYAPGPKRFDFDINEISVTADRSKVVTFSISYYDTTQSIVALKSNPIVAHHSPAQLKTYLYGDQIGTTGLAYIYDHIHPTRSPRIYNTLDEAVAALQTKQVDAIIVDTPDGQYMASSEVKNGVQVGQFPSTGEHYGLLFRKGNPLVSCVDSALTTMTRDGDMARLSKQYLGLYNSVPTLEP
ncbi:MAG TPA: ABC transporter substrate-binding protein [Acidimicrobiales bacterium]|nr:ABC transporter substrate-binding protein [Acidimicrobiales bacterium]